MEYALILKTLNSGNNTNNGKECLIQAYAALFPFDINEILSSRINIKNAKVEIDRLIFPTENITYSTTAKTGVSNKYITDFGVNGKCINATTFIEHISKIFSTLTNKNIYVIGHNILDNDLRVINKTIEQTTTINPISLNRHKLIDIQEFAMQEFPLDQIGNYSLDSILLASGNGLEVVTWFNGSKYQDSFCKEYAIETLWCLASMMKNKGYATLSQVSQQLNTRTIVNELQFGKYKGQKIVDIFKKDNEYLCWLKSCKEVMDKNPNLKYTLEKLFEV